MYEIWLMMNIVYEISLSYWLLITVCVVLWLALMWAARTRLSLRLIPLALGLGAVATIVAFLALPAINKSSFADMGYWVDWVNLVSWALTAGVLALFYAFPLAGLLRKPG
jgi:hypothetical protein